MPGVVSGKGSPRRAFRGEICLEVRGKPFKGPEMCPTDPRGAPGPMEELMSARNRGSLTRDTQQGQETRSRSEMEGAGLSLGG